jgi:DNA-binding winged helix-turn-helix (wHTH) protein
VNQDFNLGPWVVRPTLNSVSRNGHSIRLEPKAMEVLVCLARHDGSVVSKDKLIADVWSDTPFVGDDVLVRCISDLRRAMDDDAKAPRVIETIPKRGYRLLAKVEQAALVELVAQPVKRKWKWPLTGFAILLVLAVTVVWLFRPPAQPRLLRITPVSAEEVAIASTLYTDRSRIYYNRDWKGAVSPTVISAAGGEAHPVPISGQEAWIFDVAPDGEQLLLTFTWPLDDGPIFLASVLGGNTRRLGNVSGHDSRFSRDGRKVVYCRKGELRVVNLDGSNDQQFLAVSGTPRWPRWSPDSSRVRFTLLEGGSTSSSSLWEAPTVDQIRPFPGLTLQNHPTTFRSVRHRDSEWHMEHANHVCRTNSCSGAVFGGGVFRRIPSAASARFGIQAHCIPHTDTFARRCIEQRS